MRQEQFMLEKDKANHVIYGALAYAIGGPFLCIGVALGKELYDKYVRHTEFNTKDLMATLAGGAIVLLGGVNVI